MNEMGHEQAHEGHLEVLRSVGQADRVQLEEGHKMYGQQVSVPETQGPGLKLDARQPDNVDTTETDPGRAEELTRELKKNNITAGTVKALEAGLLSLNLNKTDFIVSSKQYGKDEKAEKVGIDPWKIGNVVDMRGEIDCVVPRSRLMEIRNRFLEGVNLGGTEGVITFANPDSDMLAEDYLIKVGLGCTLMKKDDEGGTVFIRLWAGKEKEEAAN